MSYLRMTDCIVLYSIVYCIVLYCIVLYCIVLYCIVLYCIVLYCIVLYCIVLYCTVHLYGMCLIALLFRVSPSQLGYHSCLYCSFLVVCFILVILLIGCIRTIQNCPLF